MEGKKLPAALLFILTTICIDSIGLGIIIPSFPKLIAETAHVSIKDSTSYFGWVMGTYAFMQFLFSPVIGNLSDRYGRRPILLLSVFGMGIDYIFMYFAPDLQWLIFGRALSGIFGASFTTAAAYIADISTDETRARNFGMIGAAFGIGFVVGPAIGGLLAEHGTRLPFLAAAVLSLLNFGYGYFILKESLPASVRRPFDWKRANPLGTFVHLKRLKNLRILFLVVFLLFISNFSIHTTWNYFTMEKFGWTERNVGISLSVIGVCTGIVQGVGAGWFIQKTGKRIAANSSFFIFIVVLCGIALVPSGSMLYVLFVPYSLVGIADTAIRTLVTAKTQANEQGELQGVFTSIMSLGEIISPPLFMGIYHWERNHFATNPTLSYGYHFFVAAGVILIAMLLFNVALKQNFKQ